MPQHPSTVLHGTSQGAVFLPVCDHYCGTPARIAKALALQQVLVKERGICPLDVTLDCEDGALVGDEISHAKTLSAIVFAHFDALSFVATGAQPRLAVRVHPIDHPAFRSDVQLLVAPHANRWVHVMLPKVERRADVDAAVAAIDAAVDAAVDTANGGAQHRLPLHALIESPLAVHHVFGIAAHPRIASLSFGLMDFVSSFGGALPESAMSATGQFQNPQVLRAKLEIAAACHAHGKTPSHSVVTEFTNLGAFAQAADAARALGYSRMWSIHPNQIEPILQAFAPNRDQIAKAAAILLAAQAADWAPIRFENVLHDRASYRLYWQLLQSAKASGAALPESTAPWWA